MFAKTVQELYSANYPRLLELAQRCLEKHEENGDEYLVICIDVDSSEFATNLTQILMSKEDWAPIRGAGLDPIAQGVIPISFIHELIKKYYNQDLFSAFLENWRNTKHTPIVMVIMLINEKLTIINIDTQEKTDHAKN